jgi:hypothetical protein
MAEPIKLKANSISSEIINWLWQQVACEMTRLVPKIFKLVGGDHRKMIH